MALYVVLGLIVKAISYSFLKQGLYFFNFLVVTITVVIW